MTTQEPVSFGLIGAGRIGSFHAETVTQLVVGADVYAIADPAPGAAESLARSLGVEHATLDVDAILADPAIEAVIIAAPARLHADIVVAAAEAGKAVFCEKPMALTLADADRAIAAAHAAKVPLQIGFNRRWDRSFVDARSAIADARIGTPQLLRSLTRDPGPLQGDPADMPAWTIFYETLIHDFDTLLSLNPGADPVEVFAMADALIRPGSRAEGFYDTAVVTIRFDNGAIAVAEASFSALYGYDVRAEVFGSKGMVTMGDVRRSSMALSDVDGVSSEAWHHWTDRFAHAYTAQLRAFVEALRGGLVPGPSGEDARKALSIALAAIRSVSEHRFVPIDER